jgi:dolichyl-phosphate-mannose--protein O-mannosyl transferase
MVTHPKEVNEWLFSKHSDRWEQATTLAPLQSGRSALSWMEYHSASHSFSQIGSEEHLLETSPGDTYEVEKWIDLQEQGVLVTGGKG